MNGDYLFVDTNAIIRFLEGRADVVNPLDGQILCMSVITEMELLCKPNITTKERQLIRNFINDCFVIGLDDSIKERAIKIRLSANLKLPDAIVAASALKMSLPIITSDYQFHSVAALNVIAIS